MFLVFEGSTAGRDETGDLRETLTALGRAFLTEVEKGDEEKMVLFARAFLACRESRLGMLSQDR